MKYKYIKNNSDKLIIVFSGMVGDVKSVDDTDEIEAIRNRFSYYNVSQNDNFDYLFIQDSYSSVYGWYILDHDEVIVDKLNQEIEEFIISNGYNRENVTTFGSSKGGYASLLYGMKNKMIGNIYTVVPVLDFKKYFSVAGRAGQFYNQNFLANMDRIEKLLGDVEAVDKKIMIVTGFGDFDFSEQLNFLRKSTNQTDKLYLQVDLNGYNHAEISNNVVFRIYENLYSFADNKVDVIKASYRLFCSKEFSKVESIIEPFLGNKDLEKDDIVLFNPKTKYLTVASTSFASDIYIITEEGSQKMMKNKVSYSIKLNETPTHLRFIYEYGTRSKSVNKTKFLYTFES